MQGDAITTLDIGDTRGAAAAAFRCDALASYVVERNLSLVQALSAAAKRAGDLQQANEAVLSDLSARTLSSATSRHLRNAQVATQRVYGLIQDEIRRSHRAASDRADGGAALAAEFDRLAQAWRQSVQNAVEAARLAAQTLPAELDVLEPIVGQVHPGPASRLPAYVFPQDSYKGDGQRDETQECRWLMELEVLPDRPWAVVPRIDRGERSVIFQPDDRDFPVEAACRAVQAVIVDQMSRAAPNTLRLTWIDTLHQGQSAGPLLDLVTSNSRVIDEQVWTQSDDIEQALRRASERMTQIEQHCLRGRHADLDDYNRQAGALAEARHVIVVSGYPHGLSATSAEQLRRITESGGRLGVSALVVMHPLMASLARLVDGLAPGYARLADGVNPPSLPSWWENGHLLRGDYVLGRAGRPYASVTTRDTGVTVWVPVRFRQLAVSAAAKIVGAYASAADRLPPSGMSARKQAEQELDPAVRTPAVRSAMIRWLYDQQLVGAAPEDWEIFVQTGSSSLRFLHREPLGHDEVRRQAAYLYQEAYVDAADGSEGWTSPRLTARGTDKALARDNTLAGYLLSSSRTVVHMTEQNNYGLNIQGGVHGGQVSWINGIAEQNQVNDLRAARGYESVAEVVKEVLAQLPQFGLPEDEAEGARDSANELLVETSSPTPNRSKVLRSLAALKGFLLPVLNQAADGAGAGAHEMAKTAVQRLQHISF
ncbi:hypothetical protein [Verrucosispora sp. WMMD1129]|uniref:hypothetical protein n=1 Tax=Verrucosispora sp. WMMD1129 TaxID=3016093 RepID=UPI00249CF3FF|nr:hypothetical protein [Verrucosispora sp. WMMD1129]WFE47687.1 hypothetical protein O7624_26840 [Verrucosispora sp. WMMD1129]